MADGLIDLGVDVRVPFGILFFVFGNRECLQIQGEYIFCLL